MQQYSNNGYNGQRYIIVYFRLLCGFFLVILLLLFQLNINDSVSFTDGEIISSTPQIDYKAPFDAQLVGIKVKAGQKVNEGDTMVVIYNETINTQYSKEKAEYERMQQMLTSLTALEETTEIKALSLNAETGISNSNQKLIEKNIYTSIAALEQQYALQKQKLSSALERNTADSILYQKDMISKMEYNAGKDITADILEKMAANESLLKKQKSEIRTNNNNYLKEEEYLVQRKTEVKQEHQTLLQQKIDTENKILQLKETIDLLEKNIAKQYMIAVAAGTVNFIYNTRQISNRITKDELLLSISPHEDGYYAKALVQQKDIQYISNGMDAHLKLDAYYHLKHGILTGKVTYVSERKENEKFYTLIQLKNKEKFNLKSGYSIKGEIITERLPLYKYLIKRMFKDTEKKQL